MPKNTTITKSYFNKYFKNNFLDKNDQEFKSLMKILENKDKETKEAYNLGFKTANGEIQ